MMQPVHSTRPYAPIADYAVIGDCRSAALVSRDGSIDWLCWPRFDSPSIFAALLDATRGGRWSVRPAGRYTSARRYHPGTNVLETRFHAAEGVLRIHDFMPVAGERQRRAELRPDHQLLRLIECVGGEVEIEMIFDPCPDYGRIRPRPVPGAGLGWRWAWRGGLLTFRTDLAAAPGADGDLRAATTLRAGDRRCAALSFTRGDPAVLPVLGDHAWALLSESIRWWQDWAACSRYDGPYADAVLRSALTLKLMTYAPSGAVVAAPTTSLPEQPGGARNWDYRYCWLRDASLTLQALFDLGHAEEASAFMSWLMYTAGPARPNIRVVYDVFGGTRLRERELPGLEGYGGARPVRIGNDARGQLQLDVHGEVIDAAYHFVRRGGRLDRTMTALLVGIGNAICRRWREPDDGIWEPRCPRAHHTYSKAMCWAALDRLLRLHAERHIEVPAARYERVRAEIRAAIDAHGRDARTGGFVAVFGGEQVDASLLRLARIGYVRPDDPSMVATAARVEADLGVDGLLYRYRDADDGLPGGEGAFGICSFWAAAYHALSGDLDRAAAAFEHVLRYANDVGLYAEEIEPATGAALGNFPQAFTHVGLIDAALSLEHAVGRRRRPGHPPAPPRSASP